MEQATNTLDFVCEVMQLLDHAGIATWLFGGWCEELTQQCLPRPHNDVDLLYPAPDFHKIDLWFTTARDVSIIQGKHFSHKRAFIYKQVVIEIFLLKPHMHDYSTNFFDGRYQMLWPSDILTSISVNGHTIPIARYDMPSFYRQHHNQVDKAYRAYLTHQAE